MRVGMGIHQDLWRVIRIAITPIPSDEVIAEDGRAAPL